MGYKMENKIIGIRLAPDNYIPYFDNSNQLNKCQILGIVYIPSDEITCSCFRSCIEKYIEVPKKFCFLTSKGWPVSDRLEDQILISNGILSRHIDHTFSDVVTIQAKHEPSKVGIKLLNGLVLGFVFPSLNSTLSDIRSLIISDLDDQFQPNETFDFIENNSWPVNRKQEERLSPWDIIINNCITITKRTLKRHVENYNGDKNCKKIKYNERPILNLNRSTSYDILISYVHSEAAEYAKSLKTALKNMGFKIFLDIDDIPAGSDWQDTINGAICNCSIFIALVTQRYGGTQWTSREAKLADGIEKSIIPISFLKKWPPDQLAIQFVTLQYIPWQTPDEADELHSSISEFSWSQRSITRVALEIEKLFKLQNVSTPDSISLLENGSTDFSMNSYNGQTNQEIRKDLIVISAHINQKCLVLKLSNILERYGYQVWNSMKMCECNEETFSPIEDTQPMLLNSPSMETSQFPQLNENVLNHSSTAKCLKREFKQKVKLSKLLILIFSGDYINSQICNQQAYYCGQRSSIVFKDGEFHIPSIILQLFPEQEMIPIENIEVSLKRIINEKLNSENNNFFCKVDKQLSNFSNLSKKININSTVYIIGGTNSISPNAEKFCAYLGNELAKIDNLCLATEGFFGAADIVGKNFCEEKQISDKRKPDKVFHILPIRDDTNFSKKAEQNEDGSFKKKTYGHTLFYGNSISERDDICAATFKFCILIEGGERSACLAEKFLWKDCIVIPVLFNNGSIKNKQYLLESIGKAPYGVKQSHWENLNKQNCSIEERVLSVKCIVCELLDLRT